MFASPRVVRISRTTCARGVITSSKSVCRAFATSRACRNSNSSSSCLPVVPLWIGGQAVSSSSAGTVITRHSQTGKEVSHVVVAGEKETTTAIRESWKAFEAWRDVTGWQRRAILNKVLHLLQERSPQLKETLLGEAAFSNATMHKDLELAMNITDGAADTAISVEGSIPATVDGSLAMIFREPYGPVLSIPAFNHPLVLAMRSIVYPLACGNTVIMRSSPLLPHFHHLLGPLFADAGLPPGVFQVLNFSEDDVAQRIEQLIADDHVRMVNFTGSVKLGKVMAGHCAKYLKPSVMELGGKAPALVLPSANLKLAANNLLFGAFNNSGQICMSTERVIVHSDIADEFERVVKETAQETGWSGGMPLVRPTAGDGLKQLVDDAVGRGASVLYSASSESTSTSFPPTILSSVPNDAVITKDESFGPIFTIQTASSIPDMIALANAHETGLSSSVFSSDLEEALGVARKIESGAVHINGMTVHDEHGLSHGGWKKSGWGRFNGRGAIESFTQTKSVTVNLGAGVGGKGMLPLHVLQVGSK